MYPPPPLDVRPLIDGLYTDAFTFLRQRFLAPDLRLVFMDYESGFHNSITIAMSNT